MRVLTPTHRPWRIVAPIILVMTLGACSGVGDAATPTQETTTPEASPSTAANLSAFGGIGLGPGAVIQDMPEKGQCTAHSKYAVIKEGVQVEISDSSGSVVAVGKLGTGKAYEDGSCAWMFAVEVPAGGGFYRASVLNWESDLVAEKDIPATVFVISPK